MSDLASCPPLERASVEAAHKLIKPYIHHTPVVTSKTLDRIASSADPHAAAVDPDGNEGNKDLLDLALFFKCENYQKIGAFKARGAFHALTRLGEEGRRNGVITHSSGNHAQALAFAAKTFGVPAHIIMPTISTPSKIAGTKAQGAHVHFSGSTAPEREALVAEVMKSNPGVVLVPPYDHPDIILGQGTLGLELEQQCLDMDAPLDVVIGPIGGGGMLSGVATALSGTGIKVFGAEPSFQGGNDAERGLKQGSRITEVRTLTIADGLRTPLGEITWKVISDPEKVKGVFSVTEEQIKDAMKLVLERMKVFIEPSSAVPLAVILYNEEFRRVLEAEGKQKGRKLNVGVIFTGGNTTVEAIAKLFAAPEPVKERAEGSVGLDGRREVENVAG